MGNISVRFSFVFKATPWETKEDSAVFSVLKAFMSRICTESLIYGNVFQCRGERTWINPVEGSKNTFLKNAIHTCKSFQKKERKKRSAIIVGSK